MSDRPRREEDGPTYGRPTPEERLFRVARQRGPGFLDGAVRNAAPVQRPQRGVYIHTTKKSLARSATVVVAPSNASDQSKEGADVVLGGSGDESGLAVAAGMLPSHGGLIIITEGDVYLSAKWDAPVSKAVSIAGYGLATRIKVVDAAAWTDDYMIGVGGGGSSSEYGVTLRDFGIVPADADGDLVASADGITTAIRATGSLTLLDVLNVDFLPSNVSGLMGTGGIGRVRVEGCSFYLVGAETFDVMAFDFDTLLPSDIVIVGNLFMSDASGGNSEVRITGEAATDADRAGGVTISGNKLYECRVRLRYCKEVAIQGNAILRGDDTNAVYVQDSVQVTIDNAMNQGIVQVQDCEDVSVSGGGGWGFSLSGSNNVRVGGSWEGNCYASSCSYLTISGASIYVQAYLFDHLLTLSGCNDCTVVGNSLVVNTGTGDDVTYDGISIDSDSNRNNVQGNTVRGKLGTKQLRYGIRVNNANCDDNLITNNDLKNAGATANFSDAGTGTVTTAGNRT